MWQYRDRLEMILALNSLMKEKLGGFAIIDRNVLVSLKRLENRMYQPRCKKWKIE
jgi:hypothetical protein